MEDGQVVKFSLVETEIELEDSLWQIFSEPLEIQLLNLDRVSRTEFPVPNQVGSPVTYWLDLSKELYKESRQVTIFP